MTNSLSLPTKASKKRISSKPQVNYPVIEISSTLSQNDLGRYRKSLNSKYVLKYKKWPKGSLHNFCVFQSFWVSYMLCVIYDSTKLLALFWIFCLDFRLITSFGDFSIKELISIQNSYYTALYEKSNITISFGMLILLGSPLVLFSSFKTYFGQFNRLIKNETRRRTHI